MIRIPLRADAPHFIEQIDLDGQTYGLEFRWNERGQSFFMSVYDASSVLLVANARLVVGIALLRRWNDSRLPPGQLYLRDTMGEDKDPVLGELGARAVLYYVTAGEVLEALGPYA